LNVVTPTYQPRDPSGTILYQAIAEHLETFRATLAADPTAKGLPHYVTEEFDAYLQCGVLAHGFVRLGCDTCPHQMLLAFSCKKRGFCPSCAGRRMAQQAAHLVEQVIPWAPTRQWVVSVPIPLRYWMAPSRELTAKVHTIIRRTIGQYYVNQAVQNGATRATVQPGSVTFLQRFGGSLNLNLHYHLVFLEGVFVDRAAQGLKPRFLPAAPPTDADIATALQKISQRVIRELRKRGISKRVLRTWCPRAMTRPATRTPSWPAAWRPRSSNALPLASGLVSECDALARGLATKVSAPP
jgi:hypothetical protein